MRKVLKLIQIEGRLAIRGIDSIFFGILMPVLIAILIGFICGNKLAYVGATYTYIEDSFGALITVGICATAFMGIPLGLADYRDKKILKHYFVTPVNPGIILLVQTCVNLILAVISSLCVFLVLTFGFGYQMRGSIVGFLLSYLLVIGAMYGMGMLMASFCKSVKIANLVCTIVYFPMLFLSGATIPYEIFPKGLQYVANILPLTQGIKLLKGYSLGIHQSSLILPMCVMIIITIVTVLLSIRLFKWE